MATIADELNAISVEHGYTGAAPKTIAGAIDALADTLAGTDVEGKRTIAGAVKALAPYIGGGGGTTLGSMQYAVVYDTSEPTVGGDAYYIQLTVITVHVGSQLVIGEMPGDSNGAPSIAAGATVKAYAPMDMLGENPVITPYVITDSAEQKYTSVTPWDGTYTHAIEQIDNQDCLAITLTIPELDASEGERLLFAIIRE